MTHYENLLLSNQLCFALYAATNAITRAYRPALGEVGLTYPQYLVMIVLWENDGLSVKEIASRLHLDSATITPLLKRLEQAKFIKRKRSKQDERIVNIFLTKRGQNIQPQVAEIQQGIVCQTGLLEVEFIRLKKSLHELVETINANQPDIDSAA